MRNDTKSEDEAQRVKKEKQAKKDKKRKLINGQIEESKKQLLVAEEELSALKKALNLTGSSSPMPKAPSADQVAKSVGGNEVVSSNTKPQAPPSTTTHNNKV